MNEVPPTIILGQVTKALREAFEGPPGPWSYFTDRDPAAGVFGVLATLDAVAASRRAGPGGTTIAGHVHHLSESLGLYVRWIRGELSSRDRTESWTVSVVDDAGWTELRARLRRAYETLLLTVQAQAVWNEEAIGGALGALTHTAYHLGAMRQRLTADLVD